MGSGAGSCEIGNLRAIEPLLKALEDKNVSIQTITVVWQILPRKTVKNNHFGNASKNLMN